MGEKLSRLFSTTSGLQEPPQKSALALFAWHRNSGLGFLEVGESRRLHFFIVDLQLYTHRGREYDLLKALDKIKRFLSAVGLTSAE